MHKLLSHIIIIFPPNMLEYYIYLASSYLTSSVKAIIIARERKTRIQMFEDASLPNHDLRENSMAYTVVALTFYLLKYRCELSNDPILDSFRF